MADDATGAIREGQPETKIREPGDLPDRTETTKPSGVKARGDQMNTQFATGAKINSATGFGVLVAVALIAVMRRIVIALNAIIRDKRPYAA